jgi:hypothetical protein
MKKIYGFILIGIFAALTFCSCEPLNREDDKDGTPYGFWVVDKLVVEASVTVNGNTTSTTNTTDFSSEYCRLQLAQSNYATLWFNFELPDVESFTYNESTGIMEFKKGLDKGDNGKAIVLLGVYEVQVNGDNMILRQPEASIGVFGYGASERATYYFHRAPKNEEPRD